MLASSKQLTLTISAKGALMRSVNATHTVPDSGLGLPPGEITGLTLPTTEANGKSLNLFITHLIARHYGGAELRPMLSA